MAAPTGYVASNLATVTVHLGREGTMGSFHASIEHVRSAVAPAIGLAVALPIAALVRIERLIPFETSWIVSPVPLPDGDWIDGWSASARTATELEAEGLGAALALLLGLAILSWLAGLASSLLGSLRRVAADREIWACRSAVGATRRQLRAEIARRGLIVSLTACVAGTLLAVAGSILLARGLADGLAIEEPFGAAALWRAPLVALLLGVTVVTGTWVPVLLLPRAAELRRPVRLVAGDGPWILAAGQIAVALAVVTCAVLLAAGAPRIEDAVASYPYARDTLVFRVHSASALTRAERAGQWEAAREAVSRLPGVRSAAVATPGAFLGLGPVERTVSECPGCVSGNVVYPVTLGRARYAAVGRDFFQVAGFRPAAVQSPVEGGAVIDDVFRQRFFRGADPEGRTVWLLNAFPLRSPGHEVTGLIEAPRPVGLGAARPIAAVYMSLAEQPPAVADIAVRGFGGIPEEAHGEPAALIAAAISRVAPGVRVRALGRLDELLNARGEPVRWLFRATLGLAGATLCLALAGLAAAMMQRVHARRAEIGIRMAVGARRRDILRLILADGLRLALVGGAFGGALGASVNRGLPAWIGGLEPLPLAAVVALGAALVLFGLAGTAVAACRASRLDPAVACRG